MAKPETNKQHDFRQHAKQLQWVKEWQKEILLIQIENMIFNGYQNQIQLDTFMSRAA